jgi:hypothetical protein
MHRRAVTENAIQHRLGNLHKPRKGCAFPQAPHDPPAGMHNFCDVAWTCSLESFFGISSASHVQTNLNGPNERHGDVRRADTSQSVSGKRSVTQRGTSIDIQAILRRENLTRFELTRAETDCAKETPDMCWSTFTKLFGGRARGEWQTCDRFPNYRYFLCATKLAQPYAPTFPGQPGLVLRIPTLVFTHSDGYRGTVRVISSAVDGTRTQLKYLGEYTKRPLPNLHIKWSDLPPDVSAFRS